MAREKIRRLESAIRDAADDELAAQMLMFAKISGDGGLDDPESYVVRDISPARLEDQSELRGLMRDYAHNISSFLDGDEPVLDIDDDNDLEGTHWYKAFLEPEHEVLQNLTGYIDEEKTVEEFLKPKFYRRCFVLRIRLEDARELILIKKIKGNKFARKKRVALKNLFEGVPQVEVFDNRSHVILDYNFEIAALLAPEVEDSYFFIRDRSFFEDLFNYHAIYEAAYEDLSSSIDLVDWSQAGASVISYRRCYSLSRFNELDRCVEQIEEYIRSPDENQVKRALATKEITVEFDGDAVRIVPENTLQLNSVLKILKDGIATTLLLGRDGIVGDFEEID